MRIRSKDLQASLIMLMFNFHDIKETLFHQNSYQLGKEVLCHVLSYLQKVSIFCYCSLLLRPLTLNVTVISP